MQLKGKFKLKNKNFQFELFFQVQMRCSNNFLASVNRLSENNFLKIRALNVESVFHTLTQTLSVAAISVFTNPESKKKPFLILADTGSSIFI